MTQVNISMQHKQNWRQRKDLWLPGGRGMGEGWSRRMGLAGTSFYIWNG